MEETRLFVLRAVEQESLVLVDAYPLTAWKESDFVPSCCEHCDAEESVGGSIYNGYLTEDGSKVGIVSTVESCSIAEDDMEGAVPALRDQVELGECEGIGYRHVCSTVHHSGFVDLGAHAWSYGGCEFSWGAFFLVSFEECGDQRLFALGHESSLTDRPTLMTSSTTESGSSTSSARVPLFVQSDVLRLGGVHSPHFVVGTGFLTGHGDLPRVLRQSSWAPSLILLVFDW